MKRKTLFILLLACVSTISLVHVSYAQRWLLSDAYDKAHREEVAIDAWPKELLDSQMKLIETIRQNKDNNQAIDELIERYQWWERFWWDVDSAIDDYLKDISDGWLIDRTKAKVELADALDMIAYEGTETIFTRLAKFLLRITIYIAVPVLLYVALKIIFARGDSVKMEKAWKDIAQVIWWVMLALLSIAIVYVLLSLTSSSVWFL